MAALASLAARRSNCARWPCQAGVRDGLGLPAALQQGVESRRVGVADVGQVREPGRRTDRRLALQLQLVLRQRARQRRLRTGDARDAHLALDQRDGRVERGLRVGAARGRSTAAWRA